MTAHLSWIDFSSKDREAMLNVVHLFQENEARDELGFGPIRDGISDYFFPGTSTIQTRARYFLFIPWMYMNLENKHVNSSNIERRARNDELALIPRMKDLEDNYGLIGSRAGDTLKRLPSNIYWNGLGVWGIRLYPGNQWQYHRSLDDYYYRNRNILRGEDDNTIFGELRNNWHPGIPQPPEDFPDNANFFLTNEEASYLKERLLANHGDSVLAHFILMEEVVESDYLWNHPNITNLPLELQNQIQSARCFSEVMNGASLLYNLILSELRASDEHIDGYMDVIGNWSLSIKDRITEISKWTSNIKQFWNSPLVENARIPVRTRNFIEEWVSICIVEKAFLDLKGSKGVALHARHIVSMREKQLKRNNSRIDNQRALELWSGAAGVGMLDYRWGVTKTIITDIITGLKE